MHHLIAKVREMTVFQFIAREQVLQDVYLKCLIFPILGLERFLEFYGTLVNTFKDLYHNQEEKFN